MYIYACIFVNAVQKGAGFNDALNSKKGTRCSKARYGNESFPKTNSKENKRLFRVMYNPIRNNMYKKKRGREKTTEIVHGFFLI